MPTLRSILYLITPTYLECLKSLFKFDDRAIFAEEIGGAA